MLNNNENLDSEYIAQVSRLREVANKVRQLVKESPALQTRMRSAVADQSALIYKHQQACDECCRKRWQVALEVAELGLLTEPGSEHNGLWIELSSFEYHKSMLPPAPNAESVSDDHRAKLERSQAAYVANCLRQLLEKPLDPSVRKPIPAVGNWRPIMRLIKREELESPPHPNSEAIQDLKIIHARDPNALVTIACLRLGALANLGQIKEIIPEPTDDQSWMDRLGYVAALPTTQRERPGDANPDPFELAPHLAEQLFDVLEEWVKKSRAELTFQQDAEETRMPALTKNMKRVLLTMARFDRSLLLSAADIGAEMEPSQRLSDETIRLCLKELVKLDLAERPSGDRVGARLKNNGRQLAGKIAD